jgi:hypothetical protein
MPEEEPLHVVFHPGEVEQLHAAAEAGHITLPHEEPVPLPVSYSILIKPPDGVVFAFSDEKGRPPDRYDGARFSLGPDGKGSFQFLDSGTSIDIEGSGTVSAAEERVVFSNQNRNLTGVFSFPRESSAGEIALIHGSVHLKARAIRGVKID